MGRYDIAKGVKKEPAPDVPVSRDTVKVPRSTLHVRGQEVYTTQERPLYSTPPAAYPMDDGDIEVGQATAPSRTVTFQWPMGHRTIIPFRNLNVTVNEGAFIVRIPFTEAQRIAEDIEQAHRRFDSSYPGPR